MPTQIPPRPQNYLLYSDPEDAFLEGGGNGDGEYPEDWVREMSRPDTPPNIKLPPGKQWSFVAPYKVTVPGKDEYGNPITKPVYLFWEPVDIKEAKPPAPVSQPQPDQRSDITAKGRNFSYFVPAKLDPTTNRYVWDEEAGQKERARIANLVDAISEPEPNLAFRQEGDYLVGRNPKTGTVVSRDAIPRSGQELEAIEERKQQRLIEAVDKARQTQLEKEEFEFTKQTKRESTIQKAIEGGVSIPEILRLYGPSPAYSALSAQDRPYFRPSQPTSWLEGVSPFQGYLAGTPGFEDKPQMAWLTPEAKLAYQRSLLAKGFDANDVNAIVSQLQTQSRTNPMLQSMTGQGVEYAEGGGRRVEFVKPGTGFVAPGEPGIAKLPGVGVPIGASPTEAAPFLQQLANINARREQERMQAEEEQRKLLKERYMPAWSAGESRRRPAFQR